MKDGPNIAKIAALLGDQARADVLTALMTDRALTATELAAIAGVTKQTMSAHLSKLLKASLIAVDQQGRHRYFRLADEDVAGLLESLMGVAFRTGSVRLLSSPREPALRKARVCYDHLAGELGVLAYESLVRNEWLETSRQGLRPSAAGIGWFWSAGIDTDLALRQRRTCCRPCMDWSARRRLVVERLRLRLGEARQSFPRRSIHCRRAAPLPGVDQRYLTLALQPQDFCVSLWPTATGFVKMVAFGIMTSRPSFVVTTVARACMSETFPSIPVTLMRSPNLNGSCNSKRMPARKF